MYGMDKEVNHQQIQIHGGFILVHGHLLFKSIIQDLSTNKSLNFLDASHVLLYGTSAGGIGTYTNADWLLNYFKSESKNQDLVYKAAPVAGFHYIGNATDEQQTPLLPPYDYPDWVNGTEVGPGRTNYSVWLIDAYLNPQCLSDFDSDKWWYCGSLFNVYKYIWKHQILS
eukprot:407284_1